MITTPLLIRLQLRIESAQRDYDESKAHDCARRRCRSVNAKGDPFFLGVLAGLRETMLDVRRCAVETAPGGVNCARTGYIRR